MHGAANRVSVGLRWTIYAVAVLATVLAISTDADARSRRRPVAKKNVYSPPYASIVVDANSGRTLQETQPDSLRHPASLTKIMTLYLLFERLESGKIKLGTPLHVSAHAAAQPPTKLGLKPGTAITAEDAIRALVTKSANDAAAVIAEALAGDEDDFAVLMTKKARALGMNRTVYRNASGLPDSEQVTTARDQATLGRAIQDHFPRYYTYFSTPSFSFRGTTIRSHNRLIGRVEGIDGIKTGYTRASGFNLVTSMRRNGRHIVAVVIGGRSASARDAQMRALVTDKIAEASPKRTAPAIAVASAPAAPPVAAKPTPPAKIALASAGSTPVTLPAKPAAAAVAAVDHEPQGSAEPIRPIKVKTIKVKLSGVHTAAPAVKVPTADETISTQSVASDEAGRAAIVNPRPGVLGVLPASAADRQPPATRTAAARPEPAAPARQVQHTGWIVQVGAFPGEGEAKQQLHSAQSKAKTLLGRADAFTEAVVKGDKTLYRARFAGLEREQAEAVCKHLKRNEIACLAIKN